MQHKLVLGNWKMNGSAAAIRSWGAALRDAHGEVGSVATGVEIGVLPPFPYLERLAQELDGTGWRTGAQDVSAHAAGAFTGEVSAAMLVELGCAWVLVGHSERRTYHGETDSIAAAKLTAALRAKLRPVLCIGETLAEREADATESILERQLASVLGTLPAADLAGMVIAYEPVWAIGTGRTATPRQAQAVHAFLRRLVVAAVGRLGQSWPILYGGSVRAANAAELFAMPDIDGGLVGGASLDAGEFAAIVRAAASTVAVGPAS